MKISRSELQRFCPLTVSNADLAAKLTAAGIEVSAIESVAGNFSKVFVAEILDVKPHPNADKLRLCLVNIGEAKPLEIVCGASNVRPKMKAPLAIIGSVVGDLAIKKSKLRGVDSCGMLCSAKELGLTEESQGIIELPDDAPIGEDFRKYLDLDDQVFEIELTPNRGDCASVLGLAREVSSLYQKALVFPKVKAVRAKIKDTLPIELIASKACPRYVGRVIRNINLKQKSPLWLQEALRRTGSSSIHPVVDITNYISLVLGQPMHAFDLNQLKKKICVRFAKPGEKLKLLDDSEATLTADTLVIADEKTPVAIAGVMGGLESAVADETVDLFLESAFFAPEYIFGCAKRYGLDTDSAYRFERGVDPHLALTAMERATQLILDIVGGEAGPIIEASDKAHLPKPTTIHLRYERLIDVLGLSIPKVTVESILRHLPFAVKKRKNGWTILPPSYRFDLKIEEDIIEEIARIHGYDQIPVTPYHADAHLLSVPGEEISPPNIRTILKQAGYHEIITYSFTDPAWQQTLFPEAKMLSLLNPMTQEMSVMRTSLWTGLLQTLKYHIHRQQTRLRFFEIGKCFEKEGDKAFETFKCAGLIYGENMPEQWALDSKPADFFDLKADVEKLLQATMQFDHFTFMPANLPVLQAGQSAVILKDKKPVGYLGLLHPLIAEHFNLPSKIYLFEINLEALKQKTLPRYQMISKFPSVRRDIAMVIDKQISYDTIKQAVQKAGGHLLTHAIVFDLYEGENIEKGKKSVALALFLESPEKTLTDKEICDTIERVISFLKSDLGAKLRE